MEASGVGCVWEAEGGWAEAIVSNVKKTTFTEFKSKVGGLGPTHPPASTSRDVFLLSLPHPHYQTLLKLFPSYCCCLKQEHIYFF